MNREEKRAKGSPDDFEKKMDEAMSGLEIDSDEDEDDFRGPEFYDDEDGSGEEFYDDDEETPKKELQVELIEPDARHSARRRHRAQERIPQEQIPRERGETWEEATDAPRTPEGDGKKSSGKKKRKLQDEEQALDSQDVAPAGEEETDSQDAAPARKEETDSQDAVPAREEETDSQDAAPAGKDETDFRDTEALRKKGGKSTDKKASKSARPKKINYVPITDEDLDSINIPVRKKKHKGLKIFGMTAAMVAVTAICAYGAVTYYYSDKFFEGTYINGIDCSNMTAYEAEQAIASNVEDYSIQVVSRNQEPQTISGSQINYQYMSDGEVLGLLKQQKPYEWIRGLFETKTYTTAKNVTYDKNLLQTEVQQLECAKEENQVEPENAYVALEGSEFTIVPETEGSKLKVKEAYKALDEAVSESQTTIDLGSTAEVYAEAEVTSDSAELQATRDAYNNYTKASITYTFGDQTVTLDGNTLKDWLQIDEKGRLVEDDASFQQHVADYVAQLAAQYDTVGTSREFHATNGRTVYVYGSAYGWKINQEAEVQQLTEEIRTGAQVTREPVYSMTANSRGYNDLGDTYIEVDLSDQHMYYYQNGSIILSTDIVSGDMRYEDRKTPEGIYTLYWKKSPDVLRGEKKEDGTYEYETEVTYWMPFNGGIGFHDATWQPYFGGSRCWEGGSHGCINMPFDAAAALYSIIDSSVPIVCFY